MVQAGQLDGILLTDSDGAPDFVFPAERGEQGERLLVANGGTRPAGAAEGARVFFAGKTWWTFDDRGDDLSVVGKDGELIDSVAYGEGPAIDLLAGIAPTAPAPPEGLSVGRGPTGLGLLIPTPGAENRAAAAAGEASLVFDGFLRSEQVVAAVICNRAAAPISLFGWRLSFGTSKLAIGDVNLSGGGCLMAGRETLASERRWIEQAVAAASFTQLSWALPTANAAAELRLTDPLEAPALAATLPPAPQPSARVSFFVRPCDCPGNWSETPIEAVQPIGVRRAVEHVEVMQAGPPFAAGLAGLVSNATSTLAVNAYLLTSDWVEAALASAARRGVHVRLLLEPSPVGVAAEGTALANASLEALGAAGVWVRAFHAAPGRAARDHAKFAVADARHAIVSTENLVHAALGQGDLNTGYAVALDSAGLAADLLSLFDSDFGNGDDLTPGGAVPPAETQLPLPAATGENGASLLTSPSALSASRAWVEAIRGAERSIQVEALSIDDATVGPASPIGTALREAASRGVRIEVLVASSAPGDSEPGGNEAVLSALAASVPPGSPLEVRRDARAVDEPSRLHAKVLVVDGRVAIVGSHNLVVPAFEANREASLLLEVMAAAAALSEYLSADFSRGLPVAAAAVALENGSTLGSSAIGPSQLGATPPAFGALFAVGSSVVLATFFGPLFRGRVQGLRRTRERRRRDRSAVVPEPLLISGPPTAPGEARPADAAPAQEPSSAPSPERGRALPPTALDLFENN